MSFRKVAIAAFALLGAFIGPLAIAQDPDVSEVDARDLARQIRRNMMKLEEELGKASGAGADRGEQVTKDIDRLVDSLRRRGDQVVKDIDDIVKQLKLGNCNGQSQGESQKPSQSQDPKDGKSKSNAGKQKPKPRDRNASDRKDGADKGGKKKPKPESGKEKGGKPKDGGPEDNSEKDRGDGENRTASPRPEGPKQRVDHPDVNQIWGNLPPEMRQKLVDRNFDEFTPEYEEQIKEYFKKTNAPKK